MHSSVCMLLLKKSKQLKVGLVPGLDSVTIEKATELQYF